MNTRHTSGFTIVELIIIIAIIGILAAIGIVSYSNWRRSIAHNAVQSDLQHARTGLDSYKNFKNSYPPNLAGTQFAASENVAIVLTTNAPSIGVYQNLTPDENTQLFLNACNANISDTPTNTACQAQGAGGGAKVHVKGTEAANTIWPSPIALTDVKLNCGAICDSITQKIIEQFTAQGGTFPIVVDKSSTPLPEPTLVPNGAATKYCLEGRSAQYPGIIYHSATSSSGQIINGPCPEDPSLVYFP